MAEKAKNRTGNATSNRVVQIAVAVVCLLFALNYNWNRRSHTVTTDPAEIESYAREHPDDLRDQLQWGEILVQTKRMQEAVPILTHAQELAPNDARPKAWLAIILISESRYDEARALLSDSLQRDPSNITAIRALANLDARMRRLRPAIQGFEHLTRLRPKDADAWQRLGLVLIGIGDNYRSLDALTRSASLDPSDLITQGALGNMALQAGRLDQADRAYRVVLARDPHDPQALTGLAMVMMRMDSSPSGLVSAELQADKAVQEAQSLEAYKARGQVRMNRRRLSEAVDDFNSCIHLNPTVKEPYLLLSECYASIGKPDLAKKASAEFERQRAKQLATDRASAPPSGAAK